MRPPDPAGAAPAQLSDVDWGPPWFDHLRALGSGLPPGPCVAQRLQAVIGRLSDQARSELVLFDGEREIRFVPQAQLQPGMAYESFIAQTGCVPTRDNLHDLLNGLMWLRHPVLKRRMNQLQAAIIDREGVGAQRGPARDALTLFDENGAVWPNADPVLVEALRRRDWHALFVQHRARWAGQAFEIFGHALLEQLVRTPRKGLVAHVCVGPMPWHMDELAWSTKPFLPMPVLGIPGWWPGQEDPAFYGDSRVFREARS